VALSPRLTQVKMRFVGNNTKLEFVLTNFVHLLQICVEKVGEFFYLSSCIQVKAFLCFFAGDSESSLECKRGDLIELGEDRIDMIQSSGCCRGLCVRSGKRVELPAECVYILPTMCKPAPHILVLPSYLTLLLL